LPTFQIVGSQQTMPFRAKFPSGQVGIVCQLLRYP
jgi:hypothetical protein